MFYSVNILSTVSLSFFQLVDQLVEGVEFDVASYVLYERDCYFVIVDVA